MGENKKPFRYPEFDPIIDIEPPEESEPFDDFVIYTREKRGMFFLAPIRLFNYNTPMTNVAEKEKTHKTSSQPLTEYRLTLLEKNYDRLENKVDRLSDKMDARFDFLIDKMDKESKRVDARFEILKDKIDK